MKHQLKEITSCPICEHKTFKTFIKCKDHNFSNDVFTIVECEHCSFKFTSPRPTPETIHLYYQNDNYISHTSSKKGIFSLMSNAISFGIAEEFFRSFEAARTIAHSIPRVSAS